MINSGTVQVVLTERKFFEISQLWTLSPVGIYDMPRTQQGSEEETDTHSPPLGEPTKKRGDDIVTAKPSVGVFPLCIEYISLIYTLDLRQNSGPAYSEGISC